MFHNQTSLDFLFLHSPDYNVRDVRTKDDALITAKVMIFYELKKLELMLDITQDPIGDFINAVCGDVVAFCASRSYEEFVAATDLLNQLETFPQLTTRAERMGFEISKVVFRGYQCSDGLSAMHTNALEQRTSLRIESETQRQAQDLEDFKLQRESLRFQQRHEMEHRQAKHQQELDNERHQAALQAEEQKIVNWC